MNTRGKYIRRSSMVLGIMMATILGLAWMQIPSDTPEFSPETPVHEVLGQLGEAPELHAVDSTQKEWAKAGKAIVHNGKAILPNGKKTKRQSKFYVCTDCHNTVREDPDLSKSDPSARLQYAMKKDIPFLQGTTLYGAVNRESWYNGDYIEKYGQLAVDAHDTLRNAIQLCATACSQGRAFSPDEMKAVLHYFWTISLKLKDLDLSEKRIQTLEEKAARAEKAPEAIKALKDRYLSGSPATFLKPLDTKERSFGKKGDPKTGKFIYEESCMHCHKPGRVTRFTLDHSVLTFKKLLNNFRNYSKYSIYQITRYGTSPKKGYKPYMPHYPKERMSNSQLEDLAAYIRKQAEGS